jgi:hypothetical protein
VGQVTCLELLDAFEVVLVLVQGVLVERGELLNLGLQPILGTTILQKARSYQSHTERDGC